MQQGNSVNRSNGRTPRILRENLNGHSSKDEVSANVDVDDISRRLVPDLAHPPGGFLHFLERLFAAMTYSDEAVRRHFKAALIIVAVAGFLLLGLTGLAYVVIHEVHTLARPAQLATMSIGGTAFVSGSVLRAVRRQRPSKKNDEREEGERKEGERKEEE